MSINNICKKAKVGIETERVELQVLPHEEVRDYCWRLMS